MKQLPLPLSPEPSCSLESYAAAGNEALVAHLGQAVLPTVPLYLWGARGCGKTHLLRALCERARAAGHRVRWWCAVCDPAGLADDETPVDLLLIDDVHALTAAQQQTVFSELAQAPTRATVWAAAGAVPVIDLPLREDLRTRLGWGHVFEVRALDESGTREVLRREAVRRGIVLGEEVVHHLLSRFERDLSSLMRLLDSLDVYALAEGRAVTVPLLRRMLAQSDVAEPVNGSPD